MRSYSMHGVQGAADRAVMLTRQFLLTVAPESRLHDVQDDPRFQHRGVDLLWERPGSEIQGIEVKGDRQGRRGNYFFELVSNMEKNTPGCFLYSTADWLMYVFLERQEVHQIPLTTVRDWFLPIARTFPIRATTTQTGRIRYTTLGAIVPVARVVSEVSGVSRSALDTAGQWQCIAA